MDGLSPKTGLSPISKMSRLAHGFSREAYTEREVATTMERDDLDVLIRTLETALQDTHYKRNPLAQAVFAARLTELRLAAFVREP